jgi:hypothetical protein
VVKKRRIEEGEGGLSWIEGIGVDGQRGGGDGSEQWEDAGTGGTRSRRAIGGMR